MRILTTVLFSYLWEIFFKNMKPYKQNRNANKNSCNASTTVKRKSTRQVLVARIFMNSGKNIRHRGKLLGPSYYLTNRILLYVFWKIFQSFTYDDKKEKLQTLFNNTNVLMQFPSGKQRSAVKFTIYNSLTVIRLLYENIISLVYVSNYYTCTLHPIIWTRMGTNNPPLQIFELIINGVECTATLPFIKPQINT